MSSHAEHGDTPTDVSAPATREGPPSRPRWVKISAIVALALLLLVGVMLLVGGGNHGPGRHGGGDDSSSQTPPAGITESNGAGGHTPSPGGHAP